MLNWLDRTNSSYLRYKIVSGRVIQNKSHITNQTSFIPVCKNSVNFTIDTNQVGDIITNFYKIYIPDRLND